jgi:hypothetical protein
MPFFEVVESILAAFAIAVLLPLSPLLRRWYNRAGANAPELARTYAHDWRVPNPRQSYTRAITIIASPSLVWAYLIQIGQERGGMYSYDLLENLIGCQMHTVDHIVPQWQSIKVGDTVRFGPKGKGYPLQKIVAVEKDRSLVWAGADLKTEAVFEPTTPMPAVYTNAVIAYYLEQIDLATTRLVVRSRMDYRGPWALTLMWRITEVLNFVMEQKMLRTIRRLAERDAIERQPQRVGVAIR